MKNLGKITAVSLAMLNSVSLAAQQQPAKLLDKGSERSVVTLTELSPQERNYPLKGERSVSVTNIRTVTLEKMANTVIPSEVTFSETRSTTGVVTPSDSNRVVKFAEEVVPPNPMEIANVSLDGVAVVPATFRRAARSTGAADTATPSGRQVLLSAVEFKGNTVVDSATLGEIAAPFVGRSIGLSDLEDLRVKLTRAYIDRGYVNSGAVLPDQKVENGNIVYQLVEGEVVKLNIKGAGDLREEYIADRILREGAAKPFNSTVLQENFQLLLDNPLIERMDGQIETLPEPGMSVLNLTVTRARPFDLSITGSNHGTLSLGSEELFVDGTAYNVSGRGDEFGLTIGGNTSKLSLAAEYEIPIRSDDTRLNIKLSAANSVVSEEPLDTIDIESKTLSAEVGITRPLVQSLRTMWTVGTGMSVRQNENSLEGIPWSFSQGEEDGLSRVTVARLWQDLVWRRAKSVVAARTTLNMGLEAFGATAHDDGRPDSQFLSGQAQLQYARRFFKDRAQLLMKLEGQMTSNALLPLERFALGGAGTVRGYVENDVVRDEAVQASAEIRYPLFKSPDLGTFQIAPFFDFGYGRNNTIGFREDEKITSAGLGILWSHSDRYFGELYIGSALRGDNPEGNELQKRGIHLKLTAEL